MSRVGGRGYPPDDSYNDRDYYAERPRRRNYEEVDVDISRNTRRAPDFLRDDYGRVNNAELVVRRPRSPDSDGPPPSRVRQRERPVEREEIEVDVRRERAGEPERRRPPRREYEEEEVMIRRRQISDDPPPPPRERGPPPPKEEIEVDIRRDERSRRQRPREEELEVDIRREERRPRVRPPRDIEREEIVIRRDEEAPRPRRRERPVEEVDIDIRREGSERPRRRRPREEEIDIDINIRREEPREKVRETVIYRAPSPSPPPPRQITREREEFVYRRREPERPRSPVIEKEEIIVRRFRSPSPESSPSPPPPPAPPAPEPVTRPPIVQEVITHYRNIDHGMIRAPPSPSSSPSPPPPPAPKPRDERLEIEIRRRDDRGRTYTEDIRFFDAPSRPRSAANKPARVPSPSPPPPPPPAPRARQRVVEREEIDINIDDYYTRKASALVELNERSRPVTNSNNTVERSLAIRVAQQPPAVIAPPVVVRPPKEMWTEITKDLVTKEGIESLGYAYEETDEFFYVMEYLRYDDVAHLVAVSDSLSVDRRDRIEQIQWERKDPRLAVKEKVVVASEEVVALRRPSPAYYDERVYEREVVYEESRPRRGGGWR